MYLTYVPDHLGAYRDTFFYIIFIIYTIRYS